MAKMGRPRKLGTPADLERAVKEFEKKCEEEGKFPSESRLLLFLGISKSAYHLYCGRDDLADPEDVPKYKFSADDALSYRRVFENAALNRNAWLDEHMANDGKGANGYMNLLKQPANGGYRDRPKDDDIKTVNINLVGVGGADNFK